MTVRMAILILLCSLVPIPIMLAIKRRSNGITDFFVTQLPLVVKESNFHKNFKQILLVRRGCGKNDQKKRKKSNNYFHKFLCNLWVSIKYICKLIDMIQELSCKGVQHEKSTLLPVLSSTKAFTTVLLFTVMPRSFFCIRIASVWAMPGWAGAASSPSSSDDTNS